jgi:hypothetical protein
MSGIADSIALLIELVSTDPEEKEIFGIEIFGIEILGIENPFIILPPFIC